MAPPKVGDGNAATVGSQGPDQPTRTFGTQMAKRWSKPGQPYDPTYRKRATPSGGSEYVVVGPDGKTYSTPRTA